MHINKIVKLKNNKYKILIDDYYIVTYDNVILKNDLLYKKSIDNKLYNKIIDDTKYYDIYNKTVKYILKRKRSKKEVYNYLNRFEIDDNIKDSIINKLININLINDNDYCISYINDKLYLGKEGLNKIKSDLINQDISEEVIDANICNVDKSIVSDRLEKLIIKKIRTNSKYSNSYLKQKIVNDMTNSGYDREEILIILDKYLESDNDILEKEYNRLYNKLSVKYQGYELINKIKQKLIQKGFKIDSINETIEKKEY